MSQIKSILYNNEYTHFVTKRCMFKKKLYILRKHMKF